MVELENWKIFTIENLTKIFTKQTGFDYTAYIKPTLTREYKKGYIPFIQNKDFNGKFINYETDYYIPSNIATDFPRILLNEKCLLVSISGSVGNVAVFNNLKTAFIGGAIAIGKFKDKELLDWCMYYLMSREGQSKLLGNVKAGSHQNLILDDLRKIEIPIPPKEKQKAIVKALSDTDELINSLEKLIAKKEAIKQGTMQQLLTGKKRLAGFSREWEEKRLGDVIVKFQNGFAFNAQGYIKDGIPIVTMAQIGLDGTFKFDTNKVNYWSLEESKNLKDFYLNNGDVIIAMTDVTPEKNLIGRMTIVNTSTTCLLNQRVGHLILDEKQINSLFLTTLSNMKKWRTYSIGIASLGVQANIGTKDILNGVIRLPSIKEQNAISQILSDMDNEIESLKSKLSKTKAIKDGMMSELLTGKTRLLKEQI